MISILLALLLAIYHENGCKYLPIFLMVYCLDCFSLQIYDIIFFYLRRHICSSLIASKIF